ncbi:MAG: family 78 glycoside hydrolase catalytic domain [Clostridia bacterium]|nr:family 78 glycoside hydrolase catalytic domain [Clostridia bacterium]
MIEKAKWIACGTEPELPVIVRTFDLDAVPETADIEITGLGFFQLFINGQSVTDEMLVPCQSDYSSRDLSDLLYPLDVRTHHRVYYRSYPVRGLLREGSNEIRILLGNGWYRQTERVVEGHMAYGDRLLARYALVMTGEGRTQTVLSDGSESYYLSHIVYSQLFIGEVQDARKLHEAKIYRPVEVVGGPDGELTLSTCPPDRIVRTVMPDVAARHEDYVVFDAGETLSGIPVVHASGPYGARIRIRYAERLNEDGTLNFTSTGGAHRCGSGRPQIQEDVFICDGTTRVFSPRFVWHAFRYFSVEGEHCEVLISELHADIRRTSTFHSRSEGLDYLYTIYTTTQLANMHAGVPSDCPHRERLGYTGDGQVTAEAAMLLLDSKEFYRKWLTDILDGQDDRTGHVRHTAPFMGGGGGPCGWGGAIVEVSYRFWRQYGERKMLETCFPHMRKWVDYIETRMDGGLVTREEPKGWCLGDWAAMEGPNLPEPFVNTCIFVHDLTHLRGMAEVLGCTEEAERDDRLIGICREALHRTYYDPGTGDYAGGVKAANAFALEAGFTDDPRTLENLVAHYTAHPWFDCGFIGADRLIDILFQMGAADTAYGILSGREKGTFLYLKDRKQSTLWEYMDGREGSSYNHPMFGGCVRSIYRHILGIRQNPGSCGYTSVLIAPKIPSALEAASGSILTPEGPIKVNWRVENSTHLICHISVPQSAHAVFRFGRFEKRLHGGDNRLDLPYEDKNL